MNILETAQQIDERKSQELIERHKKFDAIMSYNRRWIAIAEAFAIDHENGKAPDEFQLRVLDFIEELSKRK